MTKEELEKEAEEKYCKGCKWRIEQCLWAWRKTNGLKEPNEKNCSCKEVPAYLAGAEPREKRIAELERQLEISETNADTYYDELTKLQEQLVKTTQIGMTCSNCKWSQYDEDEMCYCCSNKDKWELKLRR